MYNDHKIGIYKDIIQYLLNTTSYTLQQIANLSNSSLKHLHSLYFNERIPSDSNVDLNILKLFCILVDMEKRGEWGVSAYQNKELENAHGIK
ncbi:MAG: hypothetical protein H0U75_00360 [Legionella sp.]|nr:hypothetical protein [Legionella sp.]